MKDDKFNSLMEKYVDSTKRGADADLRKFKNASQERVKTRRAMPKYAWAACAAILVVVISLSIALPIVLNKDVDKEGEPKYFYCDISNTIETEINELSQLIDEHNFSCILPSIDYFASYIAVKSTKDDNKEFGAFIELSVFDENFDGITFHVIKKQYILTNLQYFDKCTDSAQWRNTKVRYGISAYGTDGLYSYAITFTIGDYNYFINFDSYTEMSATQALDLIYGEKA